MPDQGFGPRSPRPHCRRSGEVGGDNIADSGVGHIKKLPKLVEPVDLFDAVLTDEGIAQLKEVTTLKSLNLRRNIGRDGRGDPYLAVQLPTLSLPPPTISPTATARWGPWPSLNYWTFAVAPGSATAGLANLKGLSNLKSLRIRSVGHGLEEPDKLRKSSRVGEGQPKSPVTDWPTSRGSPSWTI